MAQWTKPTYSRQAVKRAGREILDDSLTEDEWNKALATVDNWRAAHSYPLHAINMLLRNHSHKIDAKADVVRRMKRLKSIEGKLRNTSLNLLQMQDLGGCRSVAHNIDQVRAIEKSIRRSRTNHDLYDSDDYILDPKKSGYRSIHLMYKFRSNQFAEWSGLRIEVQIRSRIQHSWATAVETVGLFTAENLKGGLGDHRWLRFFVLMSSECAVLESCPIAPGTPVSKTQRHEELRRLASELGAVDKLEAYGSALRRMDRSLNEAISFLLTLDVPNNQLTITGYKPGYQKLAQQRYTEIEAENVDNPGIDVVLVEADSIGALKRGYPNYFADTSSFLKIVRQAIA
jgi:hypothetical protein